MFEIAFQQ